MDNSNGNPLFGGISRYGSGASSLNPYLNVDPSYLQSNAPEYLFNQEESRGSMEKSFTAIGASVISGSAVGCAGGIYQGVRQTALDGLTGAARRTQILNYTIKSGGSVSNAFGSMAVIYSSLYALISIPYPEGDEYKSIVSGGLTGALYKSSSGLKKCARATAFGVGLASLWSFVLKKDKNISNFI
ncbi:TIM23 [Lepeophtheirus salmonis]|uniref:Mitochondrial import inner membrane translocase subunit Tim23 n=1 Tax=Lepeophtheirus salmonis TaxID=72036 RepID=C1BT34_LEPSM|nr:mitochondrial import inner membrane translocase subunit Tim23-like [Lepeophtheirus salmonis]ACO12187.1 Mitochondrial import inner membrane translocase subunit Tim23 [Lepeophtheirus salmonis]ADD38413.1 Mitochondrial import inner membrane translocase subunit Tim23 [Lepeophtheirus salmonis]CAB4068940.1 TIM23 [Lepeophtheirus salmonis]CAF3018633.1 TIM23 [Lepeophtheirus salmonis]